MKYYLTLEKKKTPAAVIADNADIEESQLELELALVTTTDSEALPPDRFELVKQYDEVPAAWARFFPELRGRTGAVKRTGVYFGFSGKEHEKDAVITYIEDIMNGKA